MPTREASSAVFTKPGGVPGYASDFEDYLSVNETMRGLIVALPVVKQGMAGQRGMVPKGIVLCTSVREGNRPQRPSLCLERIEPGWSHCVRTRSSEQWRDQGGSRRDSSCPQL